jgi:hypothetical protein
MLVNIVKIRILENVTEIFEIIDVAEYKLEVSSRLLQSASLLMLDGEDILECVRYFINLRRHV